MPRIFPKTSHIAWLLVPSLTLLSSCAMYRELSSPWQTYHGIANTKNIPIDTIKARLKPFEAKHDLKIKKQFTDGVEYERVIYFSGGAGGTPTTCRLLVYAYKDSIHALANPCKTYKSSKTGWSDTSRIQNAGDQQAILSEIYYHYIDPTNDSAKIILERDHSDDILGDEGELKMVIGKMRLLKQ